MSHPIGTVTLLFTDIEGSTRLWEEYPAQMRVALARHDTLMREIIERRNGYIFKTIGDAFCAAFSTAADALYAALDAQHALSFEPWPDPIYIRVRMALHTGAVESRDNDYFGQPLNRVARLLAAGHGGQVLLSDVTQELLRDRLPLSVSLLSHGEHLLKDLSRPEHIYQVNHPDLPSQFAPLKTLDNPQLPNNLPQQFTSFIGREKEILEVEHLLDKTRILTVMGTGGAGKTRLCLQVAADTLENYRDGVWFVELSVLTDPMLVPQTVVQAIRAREQPGRTHTQTLLDHLKTKTTLLILDNCEHLIAACAQLANALLRACPGVKVLASSREALNVPGEQVYRIPSLSLPPLPSFDSPLGRERVWGVSPPANLEQDALSVMQSGEAVVSFQLREEEREAFSFQEADPVTAAVSRRETGVLTAETLIQYESVRLFVERASLCKPDFTLSNQDAPALAQVCFRLDGIPLAIELAAARVRSLSVEEINARLDNRFRLLTSSSRTALPRQQTLRALIDWSYDLLSPQEKLLLHRLSVFAGGWTLEAAEHICVGEDAFGDNIEDWEVLDQLTSLVDKSLVFTEQRAGSTRYRLLETVRQYAAEKLKESGAGDEVRAMHLEHFQQLAAEALPHLQTLESPAWNARLSTEHDNLRAALDYTLSAPEQAGVGLQLAGYLWIFWQNVGHLREGKRLMQEALSASEHLGRTRERAWALTGAAAINWGQGDYAGARACYEECVAIQRELNDVRGIANALYNYGDFLNLTGDFPAARSCMEEGLDLYKANGLDTHVGLYANLAETLAWQGEYDDARQRLEKVLNAVSKAGHAVTCAEYTGFLARIALAQGDLPLAERRMRECLTWTKQSGSIREMLFALYGAAGLALAQSRWKRSARLYAAHSFQRERLALPLQPAFHTEHSHALDTLRQNLSAEDFAAAWEAGEALTLPQAMEYAQAE